MDEKVWWESTSSSLLKVAKATVSILTSSIILIIHLQEVIIGMSFSTYGGLGVSGKLKLKISDII